MGVRGRQRQTHVDDEFQRLLSHQRDGAVTIHSCKDVVKTVVHGDHLSIAVLVEGEGDQSFQAFDRGSFTGGSIVPDTSTFLTKELAPDET